MGHVAVSSLDNVTMFSAQDMKNCDKAVSLVQLDHNFKNVAPSDVDVRFVVRGLDKGLGHTQFFMILCRVWMST